MSVLSLLACAQGRRDEVPNQQLAHQLVESKDRDGINELIINLENKNQDVAADCLKVLYEIGYLAPALITEATPAFLKLLKSRNNRMVWGAMIALSTVATLCSDEIFQNYAVIKDCMQNGSVITVDNAIKTAALVASTNPQYAGEIFADLLQHLKTCRDKDIPQHAEHILAAMNAGNKQVFIRVLQSRVPDLSEAQLKRVKRILNQLEKL